MKLILLCGGRSERMGEPKGLLRLPDGSFFLMKQCAAFFRAGGINITVVLGFNSELYLDAFACQSTAAGELFFRYQNCKINCVINKNPQMGAFSSLQTGLFALQKKSLRAGIFVLPIDVPCPGTGVFAALNRAVQTETKVCVPVWAGRGGHPVWLSEGFCRDLLSVEAGENYRLDRQINVLSVQEIKRVDVQDACVCYNLNKPEDWHGYLCEKRELK